MFSNNNPVNKQIAGPSPPKVRINSPSTADLTMKIESVKKVWETRPTVEDISKDDNNDQSCAAEVLANNVTVAAVKPMQHNTHHSALYTSLPPIQQSSIQSAPQTYYQSSQFGVSNIAPSPAVIYNSSVVPPQHGYYNEFGHYDTGDDPYNTYMTTPSDLQPAITLGYPSYSYPLHSGGTIQSPYMPSTVPISSMSIPASGPNAFFGNAGQHYGIQDYGIQAPYYAPPPEQHLTYYTDPSQFAISSPLQATNVGIVQQYRDLAGYH